MADIGKKRRVVRVEPIEVPKMRPVKEPARKAPAKVPERRREPVPA